METGAANNFATLLQHDLTHKPFIAAGISFDLWHSPMKGPLKIN
jgi:hypothetical protein